MPVFARFTLLQQEGLMDNKMITRLFAPTPLRTLLIVPFLTLTVLIVGLVGYLSFRNSEQAVNEVADQLRAETIARIESYVDTFLGTPPRINDLNADTIRERLPAADDPTVLEQHLWEQIHHFDTVSSIYFGNPAGGLVDAGREGAQDSFYVIATEGFSQGILHKYATDQKGNRTELLTTVPNFDARVRPWYTAALDKNGPTWSQVYVLSTGHDLAVAASRPVYDEQQKLLGVVSVDIFLSHLSDFLKSLTIGKTGQSFIIERSGLLIASSADEKPFTAPDEQQTPQRLQVSQSTSPLIRTAAEALTQRFGNYAQINSKQELEFEWAGQRHFVNVAPVYTKDGIDWLIVVVMPEGDFMAHINANNRTTTVLSGLALLTTIIFGYIATGWITQPVSQLKVAAQALAKGEWPPLVNAGRIDEIRELTHAFNQMAEQLQQTLASLTTEIAARQQAEAALQTQLEFVSTLLETIPNPVFYKDRTGQYTGCNRAFEQFIGFSREEIIGKTVHAMGPQDIVVKYHETDQALFGHPGTQTYEWRVLTNSGDERSVIFNKATTKDATGNVTGLVGIITDITERKQMEVRQQELLLEREQLVERLQLILERMPIACILSDPDFHITYWNPAAEQIFGYTAAEAMGKLPHILLVSPEVQPYVEGIQQRLRQGDMNAHGENENLTKDGRTIMCQWHNIPLVSAGTIVGNLGMVQDITERKQAEVALHESQERLDLVVKGAELGTWDWHIPSGQVVFNERWAEMLGYDLAEIEPHVGDWEKLVHPEDLVDVMKVLQAHLTGLTPIYQTEHRLRTKSGEWKWVLDIGKVIVRDEQGQPIRAAGTHQDISEGKLLAERLSEARKMEAVGQLAAGMAHHYNSMLTAIIGFTSLTLDTLPPGDPIAKNLSRVLMTAERAAVLVRQLLAFARKQFLQPKTVILNNLVLSLKEKVESLLNEVIELNLNLAPDLGWVNIDSSQFEHLLLSLISNACDAMPDGGRLTLTTANVSLTPVEADLYQLTAGEYVLLTVRDTGLGLTDEVKAHLFEPFFTTKEVGQGTGLGLAMALGIAKQHGGHLSAEGQPGQGAAFTVYLPQLPSPTPSTPKPAAINLPPGTETILLVEDEPLVREFVDQVLSQLGYTILQAANSEMALQLIADHAECTLQLLLTDLGSPGVSSQALVEQLQVNYPSLKTLFFFEPTGGRDPGVSQPGAALLAKPFRPSILAQKVRAILDGGVRVDLLPAESSVAAKE